MLTLICTISLSYLAIILFLSGLRNLELPTGKIIFNSDLLVKLAKNPSFSLVNVTFGVILLASSNNTLLVSISVFTGTIVIAGLYIEYKNPQQACNCFGSAVNGKTVNLILKLFSIASALIITAAIANEKVSDTRQYWWINVFAALCAIVFFYRHVKSKTQSIDSPQNIHDSLSKVGSVWPPAQLIGLDSNNQQFLLSDLKQYSPLALVIVVSTQCSHCKQLLPDITRFSQCFGERLTTVVVFEEEPNVSDLGKSLVLHDPNKNLILNVNAEGTPFALLFQSKNMKQIAPIAYGSEKIRILFALALNVIARST
ncbi:hypothetical protein [Massilia sp. X63]|uniref:hypothetical protein n=1 Tax=Massilia sp. X63 TaxID=3237285 RepID=UPI0034DD3797